MDLLGDVMQILWRWWCHAYQLSYNYSKEFFARPKYCLGCQKALIFIHLNIKICSISSVLCKLWQVNNGLWSFSTISMVLFYPQINLSRSFEDLLHRKTATQFNMYNFSISLASDADFYFYKIFYCSTLWIVEADICTGKQSWVCTPDVTWVFNMGQCVQTSTPESQY